MPVTQVVLPKRLQMLGFTPEPLSLRSRPRHISVAVWKATKRLSRMRPGGREEPLTAVPNGQCIAVEMEEGLWFALSEIDPEEEGPTICLNRDFLDHAKVPEKLRRDIDKITKSAASKACLQFPIKKTPPLAAWTWTLPNDHELVLFVVAP